MGLGKARTVYRWLSRSFGLITPAPPQSPSVGLPTPRRGRLLFWASYNDPPRSIVGVSRGKGLPSFERYGRERRIDICRFEEFYALAKVRHEHRRVTSGCARQHSKFHSSSLQQQLSARRCRSDLGPDIPYHLSNTGERRQHSQLISHRHLSSLHFDSIKHKPRSGHDNENQPKRQGDRTKVQRTHPVHEANYSLPAPDCAR
jgi:hypothetical protein